MDTVSEATVVVSSITHAIRGERILKEKGFSAYMDRDVARFGKYGCGYCIKIRGNYAPAVQILRAAKVKIREVVID